MYQCEICGKTYDTVAERAACEAKCVREQKRAEEKRKAEVMEQERTSALEEITNSIKETDRLVKAFQEKFKETPNLARTYRVRTDLPSLAELFRWF